MVGRLASAAGAVFASLAVLAAGMQGDGNPDVPPLTGAPAVVAAIERPEVVLSGPPAAHVTGWDCACEPPAHLKPVITAAVRSTPGGPDRCELCRQLHQESRFMPGAESPAGALGVAQFLPATAEQLGIDPLDPEQAIPAAARYVQWCRDGWDRSVRPYSDDVKRLGLCCYNWGRGNCYRDQARNGWLLWAQAREHLPDETRHYAETIQP